MVLSAVQAECSIRSEADNYYRNITQNTVYIGDKTYKAYDPPESEFDIFVGEMEIMAAKLRHPYVHDIIARGIGSVWDCVRMVNEHSRQGYGGQTGRGFELVVNPFELRDTGSGGSFPGTNPSTTWVTAITSTGGARLWPAASTVDLLVTSLPYLSHCVLGWTDPVASPKARTVQLVWNDPWAEEAFTWDWRESAADYEMPVYEMKAAWKLPPGESYRVNVRYDQTGQDKLQPIGFTVKRATDLNASSAIAS